MEGNLGPKYIYTFTKIPYYWNIDNFDQNLGFSKTFRETEELHYGLSYPNIGLVLNVIRRTLCSFSLAFFTFFGCVILEYIVQRDFLLTPFIIRFSEGFFKKGRYGFHLTFGSSWTISLSMYFVFSIFPCILLPFFNPVPVPVRIFVNVLLCCSDFNC